MYGAGDEALAAQARNMMWRRRGNIYIVKQTGEEESNVREYTKRIR